MLPEDALYRIALKHIPLVGAVIARNLISYCGSPEQVFKAPRSKLLKIPGVGGKIAANIQSKDVLQAAESELERLVKKNISMMFFLDESYPSRLKGLPHSPILLYTSGDYDPNTGKTIAIVGTRSPTHYGRTACARIVEQLKPHQPLIISGLAYGIDICAHRAALHNNLKTLAVMGNGFGHIYPAHHRKTAAAMLENGGLMTEFSYNTMPDRENFPARNRIVAGLADIVVVIESGESGGSMITAEFANGYNREVAAVPGRFIDDRSSGCNKLIRQHKAHLIESGEDIVNLMCWEKGEKAQIQARLFLDLSDPERLILEMLTSSVEHGLDELARKSNFPASQLATVLLSLELKGVVRAVPGKRYIRIS